MRLQIIALGSAVLVAACAQQPEDIAAADIGQGAYRSASCAQLAEAELWYNQQLENLSASQRSAASGDAMGVFLLGLPISSMSGNDRATEIAVTRGHLQEIEREKAGKNCA